MEQGFTILFLVGFLRTLLIILFVYYGLIFFRKFILPYLLGKAAEKLSEKMQNGGFANNAQQQNRRPEGDVTIEGKRSKKESKSSKSTKSDGGGDYVDFEEIK